MPDSISLLPEDLRKKEEAFMQGAKPAEPSAEELKFSTPSPESEDVEVIEIDEGEIGDVLEGEPPLAKFLFKLQELYDGVKNKLFAPRPVEPPPKLPPHFFSPPPPKESAKPAPAAGLNVPPASAPTPTPTPTLSAAPPKPKVKLAPLPNAPKRVRVIKRVRKPIHVSFVNEEDVRLLQIDVPKRRYTLIVMCIVCLVLLGGGYWLLNSQDAQAHAGNEQAIHELAAVNTQIAAEQKTWNSFQDLEPRLLALGKLLNAHVSPTRLLAEIERTTLPDVTYGSFALTPDKKVQLAVTAPDLDVAARQVRAYQQASFVTAVDASNYSIIYASPASSTPQSVQFELSLTLSTSALSASPATP